MKASEIVVGGVYTAKVNNAITRVRVESIADSESYRPNGRTTKIYHVRNTKTNRVTTFRSAAKFRSRVDLKLNDPNPRVNKAATEGDLNGAERIMRTDDVAAIAGMAKSKTGLGSIVANRPAHIPNTAPHVIVKARAGTGKTTTLIDGLRRMKGLSTSIEPSPQQAAVWEQMERSKSARSICFVAFNKAIADELSRRVPPGVDAMTMHSLGFRSVTKALGRQQPNSYVVVDYICEELQTDFRDLKKDKPNVLNATERLVSLCKQNLVEPTTEELDKLASHYDVDLNGDRMEVYGLVAKIIERCKTPKGRITFDDMIWLPVILNLPTTKYDLLLVDEAQDLNRCQQALAKKSGERLILVGDDKQAIYGFAGADSESLPRMALELDNRTELNGVGCIVLPLTVTRRCGKAIVDAAKNYVGDFEAHESNHEGRISKMSCDTAKGVPNGSALTDDYINVATDGDMILCRMNAPLVSQCFKFIRAGRKATIRGRDVGAGLVATINKLTKGMDSCSVVRFIELLFNWRAAETAKEQAKKFPSAAKIESLEDRYACLVCFTEGAETTADMIRKIEAIFTDNKAPGVMFSSIHKAKGLESRRVFWLQTTGGGKRERQGWELQQEYNLAYVAITRAIEELVYVQLHQRS